MTDRIAAFTVILERDIREDDIEPLETALRMLRGVLKVEPLVADAALAIATERAKAELTSKLSESFRRAEVRFLLGPQSNG